MSMFRRIRSELQCSEALGQNFNVCIDKVRILMFGRGQEGGEGGGRSGRISMFERIELEFQCF